MGYLIHVVLLFCLNNALFPAHKGELLSVDTPRGRDASKEAERVGDQVGAERVLFHGRSLRRSRFVCGSEGALHAQPGLDDAAALGFTSHWFRASRSATGENLGSFQVVSEDMPSPGSGSFSKASEDIHLPCYLRFSLPFRWLVSLQSVPKSFQLRQPQC